VQKWFQKCYRLNKKKLQEEICSELLQCTRNEPDLLTSEITCDEIRIFLYDPETKGQARHGKSPNSPKKKKKKKKRALFFFFFLRRWGWFFWYPGRWGRQNNFYYKKY